MAIDMQQSIFSELADFLISQPSLEDIIAYRVPSAAQERIDDLLEKNREGGLTAGENEEMAKLLAISHLMSLAKAKARLRAAGEA
jgi:hypothetical protein